MKKLFEVLFQRLVRASGITERLVSQLAAPAGLPLLPDSRRLLLLALPAPLAAPLLCSPILSCPPLSLSSLLTSSTPVFLTHSCRAPCESGPSNGGACRLRCWCWCRAGRLGGWRENRSKGGGVPKKEETAAPSGQRADCIQLLSASPRRIPALVPRPNSPAKHSPPTPNSPPEPAERRSQHTPPAPNLRAGLLRHCPRPQQRQCTHHSAWTAPQQQPTLRLGA